MFNAGSRTYAFAGRRDFRERRKIGRCGENGFVRTPEIEP